MDHEDCTRRANLSGADRNRPDSAPSEVGSGGDPAPSSTPIDPLVIATTDPVIEVVADYQPEWRRHPEATISLATTQVGEPAPLAATSPGTLDFGRPRRAPTSSTRVRQEYRPSREGGPKDDPAPRPISGGPTGLNRRASGAWYPWVIAGAALLGGVLGSAGYLYLFRSRSRT